MTPSFCGSVLRTLSTLSSTTYVKRGQDISNTVSQYLESTHKCTNKVKNVRVKQIDRERERCKVVRENSFKYDGLLWVLLSGKNENKMNPV